MKHSKLKILLLITDKLLLLASRNKDFKSFLYYVETGNALPSGKQVNTNESNKDANND